MDLYQYPEIVKHCGKKGTKLTLILADGSMFGTSARAAVVMRGPVQTAEGPQLGWAPVGRRKTYRLDQVFQRGVIVLAGHHARKIMELEGGRGILNGEGCRFLCDPSGPDALIDFFKDTCLCHTFGRVRSIVAVCWDGVTGCGEPRTWNIRERLLNALSGAIDMEAAPAPAPPPRKSLLRDSDRKRLLAAKPESSKPLVKIFNPTGSQTWLLCSLDADEETLYGYADIGQGQVSFGSISLCELETTRGGAPLRLPLERDKFFDKCDYTPEELLGMSSIPAGLRKKEAV